MSGEAVGFFGGRGFFIFTGTGEGLGKCSLFEQGVWPHA